MHKMFGILGTRTRGELPNQYPNDIKPKNAPIIILVITGLDPTQNDNWRNTTNSNDRLINPLKKISNSNHTRNFFDMFLILSHLGQYGNKKKHMGQQY